MKILKWVSRQLSAYKAKPWNRETVKLSIVIYVLTVLVTFGFSIKNGNFPLIFIIAVIVYPLWGLLLLFIPCGQYEMVPGIMLTIALVTLIIGLKTKNTGFLSFLALLLLSALPIFVGIECTGSFFKSQYPH